MIEQVLVDRGSTVRKGQLLASVETEEADHELEMAQEEQRLAQADYDRMRPLSEEKMISPQELFRAETACGRAAAKTALMKASLERCKVVAPFDGIVIERWAVVGQRVSDDSESAPLFRIVAREPLRARIYIPEERLAGLTVGARAVIELPGETRSLPARVVFVSPAIDPASGTAPAIVEAVGTGGPLRVGASARVRLEGRETSVSNTDGAAKGAADPKSEFRIPIEVLPPGSAAPGAAATVFVADEGKVAPHNVRVIATDGGWVRVSGELTSADSLILLSDASLPVPGEAVRVDETHPGHAGAGEEAVR